MYGLSTHLVVPLQQRYGGIAVIWRAQLSALVLITPVGLWQLPRSAFEWGPVLAMVPLGVVGTGLALVWMADLAGRVGGSRAAVAIYLVPIVAIALGVLVRDEAVSPLALGGMVLVLLGTAGEEGAEQRTERADEDRLAVDDAAQLAAHHPDRTQHPDLAGPFEHRQLSLIHI